MSKLQLFKDELCFFTYFKKSIRVRCKSYAFSFNFLKFFFSCVGIRI